MADENAPQDPGPAGRRCFGIHEHRSPRVEVSLDHFALGFTTEPALDFVFCTPLTGDEEVGLI